MKNSYPQVTEPQSMENAPDVDLLIKPVKKNNSILLTLTFALLGIIIISVFYFSDSLKPVDEDKILPTPTIEETITVAPTTTLDVTPTIVATEIPIVTGTASMVFIDKNSLNVFTNDLGKTATINVEGTMLACHGSSSGYCVVKDHTIRALEVDRASKLVSTKVYSMNYGEDELSPYTPYIDLKSQKYAYMLGDKVNEMRMNFFTRSFTGLPSPLLFTFEGEGTSGYRINTLLSTGEVVMHLQGSVYNPADPRTLLIIDQTAKSRKCETKEFLDEYHGDYRYFTTYIYDDTNKAQIVQLKQIDLQTCREKIMDTIANVSGKSDEIPLSTIDDKFLTATYRDISGVLKVRVYKFSNFVNEPIEFSLPNVESKFVPYGYREDSKTLVGILGDTGYDNVQAHIAAITGSKVQISKNVLPNFSTGDIYDLLIFAIP